MATPVFLPGESQGQGGLVGCHLWGRTELDMTEATQQQHCNVENMKGGWECKNVKLYIKLEVKLFSV